MISRMKSSSCSKSFSRCFNRYSWKYFLVTAFVYGFQELLRLQFFKCPCTNHSMYSFAMLASPTLFLIGVGFCGSENYWKVVHTRRNIANYKLRINYCLKSLPSIFEPFLPAAIFIVLVLLKGEYYACAMAGNTGVGCKTKKGLTSRLMSMQPTADIVHTQSFYVQSQLLGCGVLAGVTVFVVGITFIRSCFFQRECIPDAEEFYLLENDLLAVTFREKLEESLKMEVKRDIEEAFDGLDEKGVEMVFKQARDQIRCKTSRNTMGRFARLTKDEDSDNPSVRILDSTL